MPLLVAVHGELAPTFGLELLRVAAGEPLASVHADLHGVRGVRLDTPCLLTRMDAAACISQGGCETAPLCPGHPARQAPAAAALRHGRHYWRHGLGLAGLGDTVEAHGWRGSPGAGA